MFLFFILINICFALSDPIQFAVYSKFFIKEQSHGALVTYESDNTSFVSLENYRMNHIYPNERCLIFSFNSASRSLSNINFDDKYKFVIFSQDFLEKSYLYWISHYNGKRYEIPECDSECYKITLVGSFLKHTDFIDINPFPSNSIGWSWSAFRPHSKLINFVIHSIYYQYGNETEYGVDMNIYSILPSLYSN